jgi:hypothetical protein
LLLGILIAGEHPVAQKKQANDKENVTHHGKGNTNFPCQPYPEAGALYSGINCIFIPDEKAHPHPFSAGRIPSDNQPFLSFYLWKQEAKADRKAAGAAKEGDDGAI